VLSPSRVPPHAHADAQIGALADPTRRQIFEALAERPTSVGEIATRVPVSRPAVSQHLRVLQDASLVTYVSRGTRNVYSVDRKGLEALRAYVDAMWSRALADFKRVAEATYQPKRRKRRE